MSHCFEVIPLRMYSRSPSVEEPWSDQGASIELINDEEVESVLDPILEPYGTNTFGWLMKTNVNFENGEIGIPWAMIALDREYRLAGHFMSIRPGREAMPFTYYTSSRNAPSVDYPPISSIYVMHKEALESTAKKSIFLQSAWEILKDKESDRNWLCIQDPLPVEWVKEHEGKDKELFESIICIGDD